MKPSIVMRLHQFSHETNGAQFLIGRTRGEGGQRWLSRGPPQNTVQIRNYGDDDEL